MKRTKSQLGRYCRQRGHSFEREVANIFKANGFPKAKRKLEYQKDECIGIDLQGTEPFAIQIKRNKGYAPVNKIFEIDENSMKRYIPLLITKADNQPIMAVLPLADLLSIIQNFISTGVKND